MNGLVLSETKQALLNKLLREAGFGQGAERIARRQHAGPVPLSFGQQRLWFLQQLDPESCLYNIPLAIKIEGLLNVAALEESVNEIVRRHESFRTVFRAVRGQLVQCLNPPYSLKLSPIPIRTEDGISSQKEISHHAEKEARYVFDLTTGPLLRTKLLRIHESEHILLLSMHHIVSDGWSIGILLRELGALYNDYCEGRAPQLPEPPIQYADFALWQRDEKQQATLVSQLAFWKDQLAGMPFALELSTDHPRRTDNGRQGSAVPFSIPKTLSDRLMQTGQAEGATLFMTLLAALSILLYRYTGQEDFAIGTPVAGRNCSELEEVIGFFVNTLVLRMRLSGELTFRELLHRARQVCLGAYAHDEAPFEKLVEELQPERDLRHSPLFQVMLDLQNMPMEPMNFHELRLSLLPVPARSAKFDLTLTFNETQAGLDGALEYNARLFEDATIRGITDNLLALLEEISASPDTELCALRLLSRAEQATLLAEWSGAATSRRNGPHVHRSFELQAQKTPYATAVVCGSESLNYSELNQRANELARYLRASGFGPEMLAGICLERSVSLVTAVVAALKAGGAYVPLDPSYPEERLSSMMKDSGLNVVITESRFLARVVQAGARIVCLDSEKEQIAAEGKDDLDVDAWPQSAAYVLYTSGSTGRPKGVVVSHGNLAHSTHSRMSYYEDPVTAFLLVPSFNFDSSVAGFFWTLCQGGKLTIPEQGLHHDPAHLARLTEQHSISHLLCLPSLYDLFLDHGRRLASVRTAIVAGEVCSTGLVSRHRDLLPQARLFNEYGPTEGSVWTSVFDCTSAIAGDSVPIGRPIPGTRIYLLDRHLQPAPIGAMGNLHIGGDGVARGYLNDPALTAERFIPDPLAKEPGARLYRTGDLARYRPTGDLDFLGRDDLQVKVRGHRIEPGEIELVLARHSSVQHVAVVPGRDGLTAYVSLRRSHETTDKDLREYLGGNLPYYMVPTRFTFLDSLPLTPAGKVDRKALALARPEESRSACSYLAPRTALEEVLAGIFAAVLGRERFGITDNFFESGGHSLLAAQVVSRIRETLAVELQLRRVFDAPTVAGLAVAILAETGESARVERTAELLLRFSGLSDEHSAALLDETMGSASKEQA